MNCESSGFSLQDLLFLIGATSRTGELVLESGNNIGSIIFHEGKILQAFSPYSRAIGDLLVEDGIITEAELLQMLQEQKKSSSLPLGGMFLQNGKVTLESIEIMVHAQIRESLKEFSLWPNLSLNFVNKNIKPFDRIHLSVLEFIPLELKNAAVLFFSSLANDPKNYPAPRRSNRSNRSKNFTRFFSVLAVFEEYPSPQ